MGSAMGIHDPEQGDDLQIEVSSLQPSSATSQPSDKLSAAQPLFAPRRSRLAQRRRGIIVTCVLVVTLVALTLTIAPTREALLGVVLGPTPTATMPVPAGEDNLYVSISPHWGAVTLDGKPLAHLPVEGIDQPFHLARGVHVIRWRFPPIIDISCRLTVPTKLGDNCPLRVGIQPGKKGVASVVTLQMSLKTVVPAYRSTLAAAIQAALDARQSSEVVRAGESYLSYTARGLATVVATQPLRATLSFVSDAENQQAQCSALNVGPGTNCMMNGDCREICTAPWQTPPTSADSVWQAYVVASPEWSYATLGGRVVADHLPDIGGQLQFLGSDEHPMPITIGWDGSEWQVRANFDSVVAGSPFGEPVCMTAQDEVEYQGIYPPELPGQSSGGAGVMWLYVPGVPSAVGCLAAALPENAQGTPDTSAHGMAVVGLILHRFGVPVAANAAAHHYWPELPVADAYEQALAQQLAQKLPAVAGAGS
jgi:hypothetical protein